MNSMEYKAELNLMRNQNIDITNFEEKINAFKTGFARNYDLASRKFKTAIDEIDKTISHLQKSKNPTLKGQVLVTPLRGYDAFHLKGVRVTVSPILI